MTIKILISEKGYFISIYAVLPSRSNNVVFKSTYESETIFTCLYELRLLCK